MDCDKFTNLDKWALIDMNMIDGEWGPYTEESLAELRPIEYEIRRFLFDAPTEADMMARAMCLTSAVTTAVAERRLRERFEPRGCNHVPVNPDSMQTVCDRCGVEIEPEDLGGSDRWVEVEG